MKRRTSEPVVTVMVSCWAKVSAFDPVVTLAPKTVAKLLRLSLLL